MKLNKILFIACIIWHTESLSQSITNQFVQGKILVDTNFIDGVNIKNETTKTSTTSRIEGYFRIPAKEGDILVFSAVNLETRTKIITKTDLNSNNLIVKMQIKSVILKDVNINDYQSITPQSVGIPSASKKFTPAERKLHTATSGFGIDGILNTFSGRKQMLEKEIIIEKKEQLLLKLEYLFKEEYYINKLQIPKDHIKGFQYYCIEDTPFTNAITTKNKTLCEFLIIKLAERYLQTIANENK